MAQDEGEGEHIVRFMLRSMFRFGRDFSGPHHVVC